MIYFKYFNILMIILTFSFEPLQACWGDAEEIEGPIREGTPYSPSSYKTRVTPDMDATMRVLCLDGGGSRGAYTARVLHHLNARNGGDRICDLFQGGITGTSAGSFITLALTSPFHKDEHGVWQTGPYQPSDVVTFFQEMGREVFKPWDRHNCWDNVVSGYGEGIWQSVKKTMWSAATCFGCFACCRNCGGLCGPKYSNHNLRKSLEDRFGNMRLGDSLVPVQVVAYDMENNRPIYFDSYKTPNVRFVDAALCSSAAPTFFKGVSIPSGDGSTYKCVDGGIFDNSAAMAALRLGVRNFQSSVEDGEELPPPYDFTLLSIGTGEELKSSQYKRLKHAGVLTWASQVVDMGITGTTQSTHVNMSELYSLYYDGRQKKYFRVQTMLTSDESPMDQPGLIPSFVSKADADARDEYTGEFGQFLQHHILPDNIDPLVDAGRAVVEAQPLPHHPVLPGNADPLINIEPQGSEITLV